MKTAALLFVMILLSACTTSRQKREDSAGIPPQASPESLLVDRLGMRRDISDLGFAEKRFSPCDPQSVGVCQPKFFSVVHFQLLCRDSEGTVSSVPLHLRPLTSGRVNWQLGGKNGSTQTDTQGFGQFHFVSERSAKGQRLILRIGKQFMGFTVSEVSKVVLPDNFCS